MKILVLFSIIFSSFPAFSESICSFRYVYATNECQRAGGSLPRILNLNKDECYVLTQPGVGKKRRLQSMCSKLFGRSSSDPRRFVRCRGGALDGVSFEAISIEGDFTVGYRTVYKEGQPSCFEIIREVRNCETIADYTKPDNYNIVSPCERSVRRPKPRQQKGWMGR